MSSVAIPAGSRSASAIVVSSYCYRYCSCHDARLSRTEVQPFHLEEVKQVLLRQQNRFSLHLCKPKQFEPDNRALFSLNSLIPVYSCDRLLVILKSMNTAYGSVKVYLDISPMGMPAISSRSFRQPANNE